MRVINERSIKWAAELNWETGPRLPFLPQDNLCKDNLCKAVAKVPSGVSRLVDDYNLQYEQLSPEERCRWLKEDFTQTADFRGVELEDIVRVRRIKIYREEGYFFNFDFVYNGDSCELVRNDRELSLQDHIKKAGECVDVPETAGDYAMMSRNLQKTDLKHVIILQIAGYGKIKKVRTARFE